MAITIRNKTTEELIRKIGRRTGEGPSAVIKRLAAREVAQPANDAAPPEEVARRMKAFEELRRKYPPPEPKMTWEEVEREMDALFDYLDEDPLQKSGRE